MTRNEAGLREAARFLLEQGWNRYDLLTLYGSSADHAEAHGKHDEACELRAAMDEFREVENG